ncbi:MAG: hypothetical protein ABR616_15835 [Dermatophilaceae bacterium]
MNRNLSPDEFEQVQLFDDVTEGYAVHGPARPPDRYEVPTDYPDPHAGEGLATSEAENPLYSTDPDGIDYSRMDGAKPGWIPTFDVSSVQSHINPESVEHLVQHSSGLEVGDAVAVKGGGRHVIFDGNHRMNAAQRRGQLFIPGEVYDTD